MNFVRPTDLSDAVTMLQSTANARVLAGGQSLIPALKLGFVQADTLIDLRTLGGSMQHITHHGDTLEIGALCTHAQIAASPDVRAFCPMLAALSGGIGDAQIRVMGTIGGSLANNDPAACWPAGVLALNAQIVTTQRTLAVDDFFAGLYSTTLHPEEIITAVVFQKPSVAHYIKFEQPASRFALVGVAVAQFDASVRVAVTGLGHGVTRWAEAEAALSANFTQSALNALMFPEDSATADLHASAAYRAHLVRVLTRRCVQQIADEPPMTLPRPWEVEPTKVLLAANAGNGEALTGTCVVNAPLEHVWRALQSPDTLRACIPGCERFESTSETGYAATVRVGLGPFRLVLVGEATLVAPHPSVPLSLQFSGSAEALGGGGGTATIRLQPDSNGTRIHWRTRIETHGKVAQLGTRLVNASATALARDFFTRFGNTLQNERSVPSAQIPVISWWRRWLNWIQRT